MLRDIWVEITEQEYNKHAVVIPKNPTYEQALKHMFHTPKVIVRCEVIIPEHIRGILNVCDYLYSEEPKQYRYFKSIGKEHYYYYTNINNHEQQKQETQQST